VAEGVRTALREADAQQLPLPLREGDPVSVAGAEALMLLLSAAQGVGNALPLRLLRDEALSLPAAGVPLPLRVAAAESDALPHTEAVAAGEELPPPLPLPRALPLLQPLAEAVGAAGVCVAVPGAALPLPGDVPLPLGVLAEDVDAVAVGDAQPLGVALS
jgi:hypothetical protein